MEPAPAAKATALPNLPEVAAAERSPRPGAGESGGGQRTVRLPALSRQPAEALEDVKELAADVYDASFLEGFVRGYDAEKRGRGLRCCTGSTKKSLMSPRSANRRPWLDYFDELRSGSRPPSASARTRTSSGSPHEDHDSCRKVQSAGSSSSRLSGRDGVRGLQDRDHSERRRGRQSSRAGSGAGEGSGHDEAQHIQRQREACESLRLLVFGRVGNEDWLIQDRHRIFEVQRGTEAEIETFVEQWMLLDEDDSGTIDFTEFLDFFTKKKADKLLGMRCVRYLVGRTGEHHVYRTVDRTDLIRLLWLKATDEDVKAMEALFDLKKLSHATVEPPPLLPKRRKRELLENFRDLDSEGTGLVPYNELVLAGLTDKDMMKELREKYDKDGNGTLDFEEFLEMLCPYGFRAHEEVTVAVNKEGDAMRYATCLCGDSRFSGWFLEEDYLALKTKYEFEGEEDD